MTTSTTKTKNSLVLLLLAVLLLSPAVLSAAAAAAASLSSLSSSSGGCQRCAATGDCAAAFRNGPGQYCGTWHEYTAVPGSPVINKPCCCPTTYQCQVSTYQCLCHDPAYYSSTKTRTNKRNNNKNGYKYEGGHNYSGEDTADGIWGWIFFAGVMWWCCCRRRNTNRNRNQEPQQHYVHPPAVPCQHNTNNPPAYNPNAVPPVHSTAPIDYGATTTTPAAPTTTNTNGFVAAAVGAVTGGLIGNLIGRHHPQQRNNYRDGSGNIFGDAEGGTIFGEDGGGGGWGGTMTGDSGGGGDGGGWEGDIIGDS